MKKQSLKDIVGLIQKRAAPPPPIPGQEAANPPPIPSDNQPKNDDFVGPRQDQAGPSHQQSIQSAPNNNVSKMQTALINLAQNVLAEINLPALQSTPGTTQNPVDMDAPSSVAKQTAGKNSFNDFIAKHYMRQSDMPAVEFNPDPNKTDMADKSPSQATRMNVLMDTMRRIGNPKSGEFQVDNSWGPRTNAAVHNACAYAFALLKMSKDFDYQPQSLNDADAAEFKKMAEAIPIGSEAKFNPTIKSDLAGYLIPYINKTISLFKEIKQNILHKPAYRSYIEGEQPFISYQNNQVSPEKIADLNKKFTNINIVQNLQGRQSITKSLQITDLTNLQSLKLWQQNNFPNMPLPVILQQVQKHLDQTNPSNNVGQAK